MQFRDINPLPSPSTFITRGIPYLGGALVVCFTLNRRVLYPSFWLMECGKAGENICEAVNYHSHCSPFYSRSTDVCSGPTWRGDRSNRLLHTGLISRPIFPTRNFLSEMRIPGYRDRGKFCCSMRFEFSSIN